MTRTQIDTTDVPCAFTCAAAQRVDGISVLACDQGYGRPHRAAVPVVPRSLLCPPVTADPGPVIPFIRRECRVHAVPAQCHSAYFDLERAWSSGGGAGGAAESLVHCRDRRYRPGHLFVRHECRVHVVPAA
jgi:hypothetical protein